MTSVSYSKSNPLVPPNREARRATKGRDRRAKPIIADTDIEAKTAKGTKSRKPARAAVHAKLKKPVKVAKPETTQAQPSDSLIVAGIKDQFGRQMVQVTRRGKTARAYVDQLITDPAGFYKALKDQGVLIITPALKAELGKQIDEIRRWKANAVYVADHAGYHPKVGVHVAPDAQVTGKPRSKHFQVVLGDQRVPLSRKGSLAGWQALVKLHVSGQAIFTLALGVSLVGLLLPLMGKVDNIGVELTGETSSGKTTALNLAASLWGAPHKQRGSIAVALRGTINGIERLMLARHSSVFLGDEANLFGCHASDRVRGQMLSEFVFTVGEGDEKARYNEPSVRQARFGWLITSNRSIRELLRGENRDSVDAVLVRLMTMPADAGAGLGVLDSVPDGFATAGDAINSLNAGLVAHHGHAAAAVVKAAVKRLIQDPKGFKAELANSRAAFVKRTHVDPNQGAAYRRAQGFGAIYAALKFAVACGVLPLKNIGLLLLECFNRAEALHAQAAAEPSAFARVLGYIEEHREVLKGQKQSKGKKTSDKALATHPGFMARRKGHNVLLMSPGRWTATFGNDARRMLEELKRQSRLKTTGEGLQLQIKVRQEKAHDRMYAIIIK